MEKSTSSPGKEKQNQAFNILTVSLAVLILLSACSTPRYIQDPKSAELQQQIKNKRTGHIFGDVFLTAGSVVLAFITGVYVGYAPGGQSLKKIALQNVSEDSLQVNMLTDMIWKDSIYADMMNIRIPPGKTCRLLIPSDAVYNLYFSNTFDSEEDDEFIRFDPSSSRKKVTLYPGLTLLKEGTPADSTAIHPN